MPVRFPFAALAICSALSLLLFYHSGPDIAYTLSPQGCRMSWMSPSYVLQSAFDDSWSPFASRYSLFLYREVGWESPEMNPPAAQLHGSPVLFIPGNAGSSHQVRSIASSATRQFFSSPYHISPEFAKNGRKALDFFALEFNEDLSAFHGSTLDAEIRYARSAIDYILSLYAAGSQPATITVLAHSMGGVVATALLPHSNISALITMSTPHTLPPARLDRRIEAIYFSNQDVLLSDSTPILSLCGGATDLMVPAESCILHEPLSETDGHADISLPYRRTVFTSALEGAWTGVGHREIVWCHQVRWRIARAALELATVSSRVERENVLDKWLRDGHMLPPASPFDTGLDLNTLREDEIEYLETLTPLVLSGPTHSRTYLLPIPHSALRISFTLYLSRGSLAPIASHTPLPLRISVFHCQGSACTTLKPTTLKLVPEPIPNKPFPAPDEGADESEGVIVFGSEVSGGTHIAIRVEGADGRGWVVANYDNPNYVVSDVGPLGLIFSKANVVLQEDSLRTDMHFPRLLSNALLVYRAVPVFKDSSSCADALLPPLLQHTSHPSETHYFRLVAQEPSPRPILLHSHASGPFLSSDIKHPIFSTGCNLTIYSSNEQKCAVSSIEISIDWWGTLGRWGSRYAQAAVTWGGGVCALLICSFWGVSPYITAATSVTQSLHHFISHTFPRLLLASVLVSLLPLPVPFWVGNAGEPIFVAVAPILGITAVGLVVISWIVLRISVSAAAWFLKKVGNVRREDLSHRSSALISMGFVFLLIFVIIPWQVAFLGAWIYHFYTCAVHFTSASPIQASSNSSETISLMPRLHSSPSRLSISLENSQSPETQLPPSPLPPQRVASLYPSADGSAGNEQLHLLLLMTWLLPIVAPVLAVWVRTVGSSGIRAIWGSGSGWGADRNVFVVAPWLITVEWASVGGDFITARTGAARVSARLGMILLAIVAFFVGPRQAFIVLEVSSAVLTLVLVHNVGPRYWGGLGWNL
ncbi:uncharacterized protein FIBRA_02458 [Fibroporia radiculosa]|uniref:GPI inositol-deacylase n=1 Tax=Fibroporia radiculosa TaxID=599839 RepID=J4I926_9APHY|nr:uncharacterized protein FIBRA_02458 [Fibroporia radiculosa]CCM00426.1 predicted protein [Fibroporia radiculosa]